MPAAEGYRKERPGAPEGFFEAEAAGLRWLAAARSTEAGGARIVAVLDVGPGHLTTERVEQVAPTATAARRFGADLALTHATGAPWFGAPPPESSCPNGFVGDLPMPYVAARPAGRDSFGPYLAEVRLAPLVRAARDGGALSERDTADLDRVCERLTGDDAALTGPPEPVARLHGDLWGGNVLWGPDGVVLIDPAAHGGHRETDLAMLALFGLPHLDDVLAGYTDQAPLADGWRDRVRVHHLWPLLVHAVLFGGGYGNRAGGVARRLP